jgi:hypothetical protein
MNATLMHLRLLRHIVYSARSLEHDFSIEVNFLHVVSGCAAIAAGTPTISPVAILAENAMTTDWAVNCRTWQTPPSNLRAADSLKDNDIWAVLDEDCTSICHGRIWMDNI